jgi:hypothetical protein
LRQHLAVFCNSSTNLRARLGKLRVRTTSERQGHESRFQQFSATAIGKLKAAKRLEDLALGLRHHALTIRLAAAEAEQTQRRSEMEAAAIQEDLWTAAVPLARALDYENRAREHREQLRTRQATHAPLIRQLTEAASLLVAALRSERGRLEEKANGKRNESHSYRKEARRARESSTECAKGAATAKAKADELDAHLQTAEARWKRLIADGVAHEAETEDESDVTISRLSAELSSTGARVRELRGTESDIQQRQNALADERSILQSSLHEKKTLLKGVESDLTAKRTAQEALAADRTLLSMLQAESVDLDKVCGEAISLGRDEVRRTQEAILQLRLERADDEWAAEYLRDHGRLPPTRDVLNLIEWLQHKGVSCWSGWAYLEANVVREQRRTVIARASRLVTGVIVQDESALEVLRESESLPNLAGPVAVGTGQQLLDGGSDEICVVVGPSDDAMFDPSAAGRAEAEMVQRITQSRQKEGERKEWHDAALKLVNQLDRYVDTYPASWLNDRLSRHRQLLHDIDDIKGRIDEVIAEEAELKEERADVKARYETLIKQEKELGLAQQRASDFSEQYGRHLASWRRDREALRLEESRCHARQQELALRADQLESSALSLEADAQQLAARALRLHDEEDRIRHAGPEVSASPDVSLDASRKRYQTLQDEYESKVGSETLEQLAIQYDREAEDAHRRFEAVRKAHISKEMTVQSIQALESGITAEEAKDRAKDQHWEAKQNLGLATTRRKQLAKQLEELKARLSERPDEDKRLEISADLSPEDAEERATQADAQSAEAQAEGLSAEKQAQECKEQMNRLEAALEKLSGIEDRLHDLSTTHADLLDRSREYVNDKAAEETDAASVDVADCQSAIDRLASGLITADRKWSDLDKAAETAVRAVHEWCRGQRFASLPDGVAARFIQFNALELENRLDYFREHLSTRLEQIDADLAETDKQRDVVVDAAMSAVTQSLELLARIARLSRLPNSVPGGGRHFLDIDTNAPENPAERRARVAELIDEVIASGSIENGLELVQRATRRVARPLRVRVLHPDLDSSGTRVSIHQMANFSGGERLTGAILLYCALARLRGQQLGITQKRTSVLLLDNPIGTVNRVRYLDLQREVARALGVQLIYATGVHDIDAIASLPNIIRLRNSRRDVRRGRRVVELEGTASTETPSVVGAARVHTASRHTGTEAVASGVREDQEIGGEDANES